MNNQINFNQLLDYYRNDIEILIECESRYREGEITFRECLAIRLLSEEWDTNILRMCFHVSSNDAILRHVRGECSHVGNKNILIHQKTIPNVIIKDESKS